MKPTRRPAKDVIKGASPDAIRRAAGISAGRVAAVKQLMADLGLDAALHPPKRVATGKRALRPKTAARNVRRPGAGAAVR